MKTLIILLIYLTCYIPTLILLAIIPYITRKTVCFGICIPEEAHSNSDIIRIKKAYLNKMILCGILLSIASLFPAIIMRSEDAYSFLPAGILLMVAIMYIFYFKSRNQVKYIKSKMNWVNESSQVIIVDTSFRNKKHIASPMWFMLYVLVIIITIISAYVLYDTIPNRIPSGWNFNGEVKGWMQKSYASLLWAPMVQTFLMIVMVLSYWMIGKSKQIIDPANPRKSSDQNRSFRYMWSIYIIITGFVLTIMICSLQLSMFGFIKNKLVITILPLASVFCIVVAALILSIITGQSGSRLFTNKAAPSSDSKISSRDDDIYWKLGLFYYNPDDPSIFIEKRFGIGWTNNWSRPISWILTFGLLAFITGFIVLSNTLVK